MITVLAVILAIGFAVALLFAIIPLIVIAVFVRVLFADEVKACFERDPAARNLIEVIFTYPGLQAIIIYRITHAMHQLGIPIIPRWVSIAGRQATGVEIHPAAAIGRGLFIDHGMGVVIGETTIIGDQVTIFQGVTLGGTGKERGKRHPTIGNNVVIGAGAKVLGNITIGNNSMVGANAVVLRDVPEHSTVVGVPGRIARIKGQAQPGFKLDHSELPDPLTDRLELLQHEIDSIEAHLKEYRNKQIDPPTR